MDTYKLLFTFFFFFVTIQVTLTKQSYNLKEATYKQANIDGR